MSALRGFFLFSFSFGILLDEYGTVDGMNILGRVCYSTVSWNEVGRCHKIDMFLRRAVDLTRVLWMVLRVSNMVGQVAMMVSDVG